MIRFTAKTLVALLLVGGLALGTQGQISAPTAPPLEVKLTVDPERVFVKGLGNELQPQEAEVTLSLVAPIGERMPVDLFIAVDRSATVSIPQMAAIGVAILDQAGSQDRVGLVSFASEAKVDVALTDNRRAVEDGLKNLINRGRTAVGEGIFLAVNELIASGRSDANWAIILLTDGRSNVGRAPLTQAQRAADNGVRIFTVGVGRGVDRAVMSEIAKVTRGEFFEKFDDSVPRSVFKSFDEMILARSVRLLQTLPAELTYESASENPPSKVTPNANKTTTLEWAIDELRFSEAWKSVYKISGSREGTYSLTSRISKLTYTDFRGKKVERDLPDVSLRVRGLNRPPVAGFDLTPSIPSTADEISFIDQSSDPDGGIASWHWDFGDGATSTQASPTHKYAQDGSFTVTLTVTDIDGLTNSKSKTIKVETLKVSVKREINTYLPSDETMVGQTFTVTLTIQINQKLFGLGIEENFPDSNWQMSKQEGGSASFKNAPTTRLQWLYREELAPGTTKTIVYEVKINQGGKGGKIAGTAASAFPAFDHNITGEGAIKVLDKLPLRILLSRWSDKADPSAQASSESEDPLSLRLGDRLTLAQILLAVKWWLEDSAPQRFKDRASGALDFKTMQELIAYWLTDTSVHENLVAADNK
jgi:PKD repeat protein